MSDCTAASCTRTVNEMRFATVGVPEITPVVGFILSPGGSVPARYSKSAIPPLPSPVPARYRLGRVLPAGSEVVVTAGRRVD